MAVVGEEVYIGVKRVCEDAKLPRKAYGLSAGYDLYSVEDAVVPARGSAQVGIGIVIEIPKGYYGVMSPRSGLAFKHSIEVFQGVIDEDFRGVLKTLLFNMSDIDYNVTKGDRICQIVFQKYLDAPVREVFDMEETERGEQGFGSSGFRDKTHPATQPRDEPLNINE